MFLSLLSKESAIVLPAVAALAGWLLPREETAPPGLILRLRRLLANPALFSIPAGAVTYLAVRLRVVGLLTRPPDFADNALWYLGPATRLRTAVVILVKNFFAWLWPFGLAPDYSWPQLPALRTWASPAFWASALLLDLLAVLLWRLRRHRTLLFGALFALLALLPVSNLLFAIGTIRANRLLYLPAAGMALVVGWLAQQIWERWCAAPATAPPSIRAERRRAQTASGRRKLSPQQRAAVLAERQQPGGALSPLEGMAVGLAQLHLGQFAAAAAALQPVVAALPGNARAHLYYGQALHALGRDAEARQQLLWLGEHAGPQGR